eukprot:90267-Lingulodinium_polyedra.AAC.1
MRCWSRRPTRGRVGGPGLDVALANMAPTSCLPRSAGSAAGSNGDGLAAGWPAPRSASSP